MLKEFNIFDAPLSGRSLVEAGAGTGKTYNIASLYVRVILEKQQLPASILVLTYTEAATAELKQRLRDRIKESIAVLLGGEAKDQFLDEVREKYSSTGIEILQKALYQFDEARISTIHGFCQRILKENSLQFGVNPDFEILTDETELLQEVTDQYWRSFISNSDSPFKIAVQNYMLDQKVSPDSLCTDIRNMLGKHYSEIYPKQESISGFEHVFNELTEVFAEIRKVFKEEYHQLVQVLNSGSLNAKVYNNYKFDYLNEVEQWLQSEITPLTPVNKLELFGSKLQNSVNKNHEVPDFRIHPLVDDYINKASEFELLYSVFLKEAAKTVLSDFEAAKEEQNLLSYQDLLSVVEKGLTSNIHALNEEFRAKFPVALIDEFQDTDPVQYSVFKSIYGESEESCFFMIGDPKQAIYSFRGADIHTYLKAREEADSEQQYSLRYNYRSNPKLIDSVNALFSRSENPFLMEKLEFLPAKFPDSKKPEEGILTHASKEQASIQFLKIDTDLTSKPDVQEQVALSVASEMVELLNGDYSIDGKKILPKDIAVLVRSNKQAQLVRDVLRTREIRSVIKSKESVFQTRECQEMILILSAVSNPVYEDGIRAALSTEALGYSASDIFALLEDEQKWEGVISIVYDLHKKWNEFGFREMIGDLMHKFQVEMNLGEYFDAERRITNFYHLIELLKKAERENGYGPQSLLKFLNKKNSNDSGTPGDEEVIRLESDADLVQIVTIHASKGLEYPIVFCPFLYEGLKTSENSNSKVITFHCKGKPAIDLGTTGDERKEHFQQKVLEDFEDSLRLTYVALTRARTACFVHIAEQSGLEISTLSGLIEGTDVVYERIISKTEKTRAKFDSEVLPILDELSEKSSIQLRDGLITKDTFRNTSSSKSDKFEVLNFARNDLHSIPAISSFSALTEGSSTNVTEAEREGFDYDAISGKSIGHIEVRNRFTLPKGAHTGTLIHNIFEGIDFTKEDEFREVVEKQIDTLGFSAEWTGVLLSLISDSVDHILTDGIRLGDIPEEERLVEMEFHFPMKDISLNSITEIIRGENSNGSGKSVFGFMKGFIDLIFRKDWKYYILDYKSNFLGETIDDYSQEAIREEIIHANYDLQYHIYTVALHRMLSNQLSGYSYEEHFGGVFYLFVRGVDVEEPGTGVFFNKPDASVINSLDALFRQGESV